MTERLEVRSLLTVSPLDLAVGPEPANVINGTISSNDEIDTYTFSISDEAGGGSLQTNVTTTGGGFIPRLSLAGPKGELLIQSDEGRIVQHIQPGTYELQLSAQAGLGAYQLDAKFTPTQPPFAAPVAGKRPTLAIADVDGDGIPDLVTANYNADSASVLLGAGDGSFQEPRTFSIIPPGGSPGAKPLGVAAGDVNGDGHPDIVTANFHGNSMSLLLGNGDATFQPARSFEAGAGPLFPVIAEVNGDGLPDVFAANYYGASVSKLLGDTPEGFAPNADVTVGVYPAFISLADVDGDDNPDLLAANFEEGSVSVLLGKGDGTFQPHSADNVFPTGSGTFAAEVADFNGDGHVDLVSPNRHDSTVAILPGDGTGSFGTPAPFDVGRTPYALALAEFNGDGRPDIAVLNRDDGTVSVLLGNGDGTVQPQRVLPVGQRPLTLRIADVNLDGVSDILAGNADDNTISVLLGRGDGTFFLPASAAAASGKRPFLFATGDLNEDGLADIVTANSSDSSVAVILEGPDGSFQPHQTFPVGDQPIGVALADFDNDGHLDVVITNKQDSNISVLLGDGTGSLGPQTKYEVGAQPLYAMADDLNADGNQDIIISNLNSHTMSVLLGKGDGTFDPHTEYPTGLGTYGIAIADISGDGIPDIVSSTYHDSSITILLGNGDGTFQDKRVIADVGTSPAAIVLGDVNGDGNDDIVVALDGENNVGVLFGNGDSEGTFESPQIYRTGGLPTGVALADVTGDSILEIVVSNRADNNVSVLEGHRDGTFADHKTYAVGRQPFSIAAADVTGDGQPDIITANASSSSVSVIKSNGDSTFEPQQVFGLSKKPYAVVVADVSGDGNPDTITANYATDSISVRRGNGNGSFQAPESFDVGDRPMALTLADFNGDGRTDIVTANSRDNTVGVLLGNGNGTFQEQNTFPVGQRPVAVEVRDLNGDGIPDVVASNYSDDSVSVLLGVGDGSFEPQDVFPVGNGPIALTLTDFNDDSLLDLAIANIFDNTVSVVRGNGDGTFQAPATTSGGTQLFDVGTQPYDIDIADVNGDGNPDLVTANYGSDDVSILLGDGSGAFEQHENVPVGERPLAIAASDVNGDGRPDFVVTNRRDGTLTILQNSDDGFSQETLDAGTQPVSTAVANVNGDGRPNIVTVNYGSNTPRVLLASTGSFKPATPGNATESLNNVALVDLDEDGVRDSVILDASGNVLFRKGLDGEGSFASPVILNPGRRARDLTIVNLDGRPRIATTDSSFDATLTAAANQFVYTVSLYSFSSGTFSRTTAFTSLLLPTRILGADLTGNNNDDIVVANSLDNRIQVAIRNQNGTFREPITLTTGEAPSNLLVTNIDNDGLPDIVATDQASGDVSAFLNDPTHSFSESSRFRAGNGLFGLDTAGTVFGVASLLQSVSVTAGDFTGNGRNDLAIVNRGAHSFSVLSNNGAGGFDNPVLSQTTSTSDGFAINTKPGAIVSGDFNRDQHLDLAVLMEDAGELWIYAGNEQGTFQHSFTAAVGDQTTGLTVVEGRESGLLDLIVGNGFGDVLHLEGKGDGTFQIRGNRVSLSVVPDLFGPGQAGVLVGNQQDNRVTVQAPTSEGSEFEAVETLGADNTSQLAPGDVQWSLLARDATLPDAVVVSTGGNAVIVYQTISVQGGSPVFSPTPQTYFVGTAPTSVTIADIDGDDIPDMLIANRGSNDVSVLKGSYGDNGEWIGEQGPRLNSGGAGPIAVTVRDLNNDSIPDLAVTNGGSGKIALLPGVGQGFFDDREPQTLFDLGGAVEQSPTFRENSDMAFAVTAGGLIRFDLNDPEGGTVVAFSNDQIVAARALPDGDVVVAIADGSVKVLSPEGGEYVVTSELRAQATTPASPSSLVVLQQADGQFQVLVSSQGSDTVSVFAAGAVAATVFPALTVNNPPPKVGFGGGFNILSNIFSTNLFNVVSNVASGLSLSGFSSQGSLVFSGVIRAALVAVEGDSYSNVAVLDFGTQQEDLSGDGRGRMPWLSHRYSFGDKSPLARFVIGLDDAIKGFRSEILKSPLDIDTDSSSKDPWSEDLFHQRRSQRRTPDRTPATDGAESEVPEASGNVDGDEDRKTSENDGIRQSDVALESASKSRIPTDAYWEQYGYDDDHWLLSDNVLQATASVQESGQ